jgi:NAD(P)-dependent dehydrogenase (short-subunit alcohol dehydrogenase family)
LAFVSGSTNGIGFAIAKALAGEGARVIVSGHKDTPVEETLASIRKSIPDAEPEGFAADLATKAGADALVRRYPSVDILVNNMGIYESKPFEEITDDWQRFFEVNVMSAVRLFRSYLPEIKKGDLRDRPS